MVPSIRRPKMFEPCLGAEAGGMGQALWHAANACKRARRLNRSSALITGQESNFKQPGVQPEKLPPCGQKREFKCVPSRSDWVGGIQRMFAASQTCASCFPQFLWCSTAQLGSPLAVNAGAITFTFVFGSSRLSCSAPRQVPSFYWALWAIGL